MSITGGIAALGGLGSIVGAGAGLLDTGVNIWSTAKQLQIANENLSWQKEFSKSRYQRTTMDMKKAGLNPILAASGGFSPQGGTGGTSIPAFREMASLNKMVAFSQMRLNQANTAKTLAEQKRTKTDDERLRAEIDILKEQLKTTAYTGRKSEVKEGLFNKLYNWLDNTGKSVKDTFNMKKAYDKYYKLYDQRGGKTQKEKKKKTKDDWNIRSGGKYYKFQKNSAPAP